MPKLSKWKTGHIKCQAAVDDVRAHYEAENGRLREALAQIVGAFTNGIYCSNCGESLDDGCACIIGAGRKVFEG